MSQFPEHIDLELFQRMFINGWIVDGRSGGLITGRTHDEGHILMISPSGDGFEFTGAVSGGEYLLSTQATAHHRDRLREINSDLSPCDASIQVTQESRMINTRADPHDKFLIVYEQYIINPEATKRHFEELEHINSFYPTTNGKLLPDDVVQKIAAIKTSEFDPPEM